MLGAQSGNNLLTFSRACYFWRLRSGDATGTWSWRGGAEEKKKKKKKKKEEEVTLIKSNNPHLAGGEMHLCMHLCSTCTLL